MMDYTELPQHEVQRWIARLVEYGFALERHHTEPAWVLTRPDGQRHFAATWQDVIVETLADLQQRVMDSEE